MLLKVLVGKHFNSVVFVAFYTWAIILRLDMKMDLKSDLTPQFIFMAYSLFDLGLVK